MTNQEKICALLRSARRTGMEETIQWLTSGDSFFDAAASFNVHDNFRGGLASHSLEVYNLAMADWEKRDEDFRARYPKESVIIAALLHDVLKKDVYVISEDGFPIRRNDVRSLGHGLRSVKLLENAGLQLTDDERLAIWWHMGEHELKENDYNPVNPYEKEFHEAMANPFCQLIHMADDVAADVCGRQQKKMRWDADIWNHQEVLHRLKTTKQPRIMGAVCVDVYKHNMKVFAKWGYTTSSGREISLGDRQALLDATKVYRDAFSVADVAARHPQLTTGVVNEDCLITAKKLIDSGCNPAVLNLADALHACGMYNSGSSAQEESLCRASTLSQSLYQYFNKQWAQKAGVALRPESAYPMDVNHGGIYSPVVVFRDNAATGFALREEPFETAIISVAALNFREDDKNKTDNLKYRAADGGFTAEGAEVMRNKIRTIMRMAIANGHDSVVLGAFGCGVFGLKADLVAALFREVLNEGEFVGRLSTVVFAIMEGRASARKKVEEEGKMAPFYTEFGRFAD